MEQLLEDLLKSFDNNEFADTLNLAEQILKKQKKSNKLTALQLANTSLLKAGALACLG